MRLKPGATLNVGPYRFTGLAAPEGYDGAISVELVKPLAEAASGLATRAPAARSPRCGCHKRWTAWVLALAVLVVFFAVPSGRMLRPALAHGLAIDRHHRRPFLEPGADAARATSRSRQRCAACHAGRLRAREGPRVPRSATRRSAITSARSSSPRRSSRARAAPPATATTRACRPRTATTTASASTATASIARAGQRHGSRTPRTSRPTTRRSACRCSTATRCAGSARIRRSSRRLEPRLPARRRTSIPRACKSPAQRPREARLRRAATSPTRRGAASSRSRWSATAASATALRVRARGDLARGAARQARRGGRRRDRRLLREPRAERRDGQLREGVRRARRGAAAPRGPALRAPAPRGARARAAQGRPRRRELFEVRVCTTCHEVEREERHRWTHRSGANRQPLDAAGALQPQEPRAGEVRRLPRRRALDRIERRRDSRDRDLPRVPRRIEAGREEGRPRAACCATGSTTPAIPGTRQRSPGRSRRRAVPGNGRFAGGPRARRGRGLLELEHLQLAACARRAACRSTISSSDADVQRMIVAQAVGEAQARGAAATIAVVDRVGNVLAVFQMTGAPANVTIASGRGVSGGLERQARALHATPRSPRRSPAPTSPPGATLSPRAPRARSCSRTSTPASSTRRAARSTACSTRSCSCSDVNTNNRRRTRRAQALAARPLGRPGRAAARTRTESWSAASA
mgnify:CR=1 FL=1